MGINSTINHNLILLSVVILLALVVIPEIYAQEAIANPKTVNLRGDFPVTFNFVDSVSVREGVTSPILVRFTLNDPRIIVTGVSPDGNNRYNISDHTRNITFLQTDRNAAGGIHIEYNAGVNEGSHRTLTTNSFTINLNPATGPPPAIVERPTHIPILPSQAASGFTLHYREYIDTGKIRTDFAITMTYNNPAHFNILGIKMGTDPQTSDDDVGFVVTQDNVVFNKIDPNFKGTIPFTMAIRPIPDNTHFIRAADGVNVLAIETFELRLIITDEQTVLQRTVDVSLQADKPELNYKDFIPTDRPFSDWEIELTYRNSEDFNKLGIRRGTDAPNGDLTFKFTSETVEFIRADPTFRGTIPLSMKITPIPAGTHFVGSEDSILFSDTINVNLLVPAPFTPAISAIITPGAENSINFNGITDADLFDQLIITFDTTQSDILEQGSFIDGVIGTEPIFTVNSQTVTFTAKLSATLDTYPIPYTVVNSIGATSSDVMTLLIDRPSIVNIDANAMITSEYPTAGNLTISIIQDAQGTIDFTNHILDAKDDLATLAISINTDDSIATGPGVTTPASFFVFDTSDVTDNTNTLDVTAADRIVNFTPLFYAPLGVYTFPYTVTDSDGNSNIEDAHIAITVGARVNEEPTAITITEPASGTNVDIDFYAAISDDTGVDDLIITFSFDNIEQKSIFVPSSDNSTVDNIDSNLYTLNVNPVTFEFIAAPSVTTAITLSYTVTDRNGGTAASTVTINYTVDSASTNVPPTANPIDAGSIIIGTSSVVSVDFRNAVSDDSTSPENLRILFTPPSHLSVNSEDATLNTNSGNYTLVQNPVRISTTDRTVPENVIFDYIAIDLEGLGTKSTVSLTTLAAVCNSENMDSDNLSFGILENDQISNEISFMVKNTGNIPLDLTLDAEHWIDHNNIASTQQNPAMVASSTAFATLPQQDYSSKTKFGITGEDYSIGSIIPENIRSIYLQLDVDLIDESFRGNIRQDADTTISCLTS